MVAALLVFRVIYYWVPLLIAGIMLGYHEVKLAGDAVDEGEEGEQRGDSMPAAVMLEAARNLRLSSGGNPSLRSG